MLLHVNRRMWNINTVIEALRKLNKKEAANDEASVIDDENEEKEHEHPEMFGEDSDVEEEKLDEAPVEEQEEEEDF